MCRRNVARLSKRDGGTPCIVRHTTSSNVQSKLTAEHKMISHGGAEKNLKLNKNFQESI